MTRIFKHTENPFNAADSVRGCGYAAIEGTKSNAVPYCMRVIKALSAYTNIEAKQSYLNVSNRGYLYFVYDSKKLTLAKVESLIEALDVSSV
jgi:hypothetical protein